MTAQPATAQPATACAPAVTGSGLLDGKRLLVTGVLTRSSIAYHVARIAQAEGAQLVLTSFGRALPVTEATADQLPCRPPVLPLDVTAPFHGLHQRGQLADVAVSQVGQGPLQVRPD
jgi:hypothetical protein